MEINFLELIPKFDAILDRGLTKGVGDRSGQMCIEAAICAALDLPHGDDPECVAATVRSFKIALNDANWSSPIARAKGLRNIGIAQIGSRGVVNDIEFAKKLADKTIRILIPKLFRELFPENKACLDAASRCEAEGTAAAAEAAWAAARAAAAAAAWVAEEAARVAEEAAWAAEEAGTAWAAASAARASAAWSAGKNPDAYLILMAEIGLEVLRELQSPGCEWV